MSNSVLKFGAQWLGQLPDGWDQLRARYLFTERKEKSTKNDTHLTPSQKYAVLPQDEYMKRTGNRVVLNLTGSDNMKHVEEGDFVIHLRSFQGGIEYSGYTGKVSNAYTVLEPKDNVDSGFFKHVLKSHGFISELSRTTDQLRDGQSIKFSQLDLLEFPSPKPITQQKIADFLDQETAKIDNLIAKQERLLELLEEKRRATITHAVTRGLDPSVELKETNIPWMPIVPESWNLIKLGYLVKILSGYSPEQAKPKSSGVHPFYKVDSLNSVDDTGCITSAKDYVSDSKLVEQPVFIVFPKRGGAIFTNKVAIVKNSACFDTNLMGLRPVESKLLPEFIYHWIKVRTLGELADTSTLPQINNKHIAPLPIGLPPIDEQREIINYINTKNIQTDKLKQKIQTQIKLLKERRTSLITHAVTGKVKI